MPYKLIYTRSAYRDLDRLDKKVALRILKKVEGFLALANPMSKAKKLKNFKLDTYRFRIGDYRAVFRLDEKSGKLVILVILKVAHRKEVYKK